MASSDLGQVAIDFLYEQMQIDDQWSVRSEREFEWWGWNLRQRVWADAPIEGADPLVTKVSMQCDLAKAVPDTDRTYLSLPALNGIASLSAAVYDPADKRLSLRSSAYVHESNWAWLQRLLASVCAIQAADAHAQAPSVADLLAGVLDESSHPISGPRDEADDMLNILSVYVREGAKGSPFDSEEIEKIGKIEPAPWILANSGGEGFVAEFPFSGDLSAVEAIALEQPPQSSLLRVAGQVSNPRLGNGAGFRLELPINLDGVDGCRKANELNLAEASRTTGFPMMGAWSGPGCSFEMFLPAATFQPNLLAAVVFYQAARARWVSNIFRSAAS